MRQQTAEWHAVRPLVVLVNYTVNRNDILKRQWRVLQEWWNGTIDLQSEHENEFQKSKKYIIYA